MLPEVETLLWEEALMQFSYELYLRFVHYRCHLFTSAFSAASVLGLIHQEHFVLTSKTKT